MAEKGILCDELTAPGIPRYERCCNARLPRDTQRTETPRLSRRYMGEHSEISLASVNWRPDPSSIRIADDLRVEA